MKNLTKSQIEQIKSIKSWTSCRFHGNRKRLGSLPVSLIKEIVEKKVKRNITKQYPRPITQIEVLKKLLKRSLESKGTGLSLIHI